MKILSALLLLVLASGSIAAESGPASMYGDAQGVAKRAKIGLVLAGGGAKGAAHVGVLKVLEEMRIPIDFIAGTSMGSVIGGLYASGMSPDEIERQINRIDWVDVFLDDPKREDRSFRRKSDDYLYLFAAKPGFNEGKVELPLAYVHGQKFDLELNRLTLNVSQIKDFDKLPVPYRAVATDLETGKEVVLKSGNLARSIRASMAVPGAFDPVVIDDKLLVDGGLANNIPVNVAREMGADIIIVSDLGSDLMTRKDIKSALDVAGQMVNFLFALNSQEQLKSLGIQDVHIVSRLGDIGAGSFDKIKEAIPIGEKAARQAADSLRRYSVSKEAYRQYLASRPVPPPEGKTIAFIQIKNDSKVGDEVISSRMTLKPGDKLDISRLEQDIQEVYGLEIFETVRYEVVTENDRTGVIIQAKAKPWGPNYLQAGLITSSNFEGDSAFRLGAALTMTEMNSLNGEWRIAAQIGDEPALFTDWFQPLDPAARWFVHGKLGYLSKNFNLYDGSGQRYAEANASGFEGSASFGRQFGTWGEARLGYYRSTGTIDISTGPKMPDQDFDTGQFFLRLSDDKADNVYFPRQGHLGRLEWRMSRESFGADTDFDQVSGSYNQAFSWGENTLIGGILMNTTVKGDAPIQSLYRLGGLVNLSGYEEGELTGQNSGLARVIYMRRLGNTQFFKAYLGGSLELGNVWQDTSDIALDNTIFAGSLFIGADTPIGPLYLGYGRTDGGDQSLYLFMGPLFSFR